jgi:CubicO group peptidase (beta-lactamase class C family)
MAFDFETGITVSNGGLNAPVADMARYIAFLMAPASTASGDAVLKRSSLEEMWQPQVHATDGEGATGAEAQAGLSFFLERHAGVDLIAHSGNQNGFMSYLYLHPSSRTGFVVAFNTEVTATRSGAARPSTRQAAAAMRDAIIREVIASHQAVQRAAALSGNRD